MLEKTLESPLDCKEIQLVHPKGDQSWMFIGRTDVEAETPNTLATSCEELTHWKRLWYWEGLGAGGEGHDRGWDGWMASPTQWTWIWVNSGSWWWTGRPGVLWFMGSQTVRHDWGTELEMELEGVTWQERDRQPPKYYHHGQDGGSWYIPMLNTSKHTLILKVMRKEARPWRRMKSIP